MFKRILLVLLVVLLSTITVMASGYPNETIHFILPVGPGGGSDISARTAVKIMVEEGITDADFYVENIGGGSSAIGLTHLIEKEKGNNNVLYLYTTEVLAPKIRGVIPYDYKDITFVAILMADGYCVTVQKDSPFQTMDDLISYAKTNRVTIGGMHVGTSAQFIAYLLAEKTGGNFAYIPYADQGELSIAALQQEVDVTLPNPAEVREFVRAGTLRVLATSNPERVSALPDTPTLKELGIDIEFVLTRGIGMPAGVSDEARDYWIEKFTLLSQNERWQKDYLEANSMVNLFKPGQEAYDYYDKVLYPIYRDALTAMGLAKED